MMPRVVHVTTAHKPFDPRIFHRECRSLAEAGFDVHLVAPHTTDERRLGVSIHGLPLVEGRRTRVLLQRHAFQQARRLNADVYHIHDPELIPLAFALKQSTGARIVYDAHEDYAARGGGEGYLIRCLERWCYRWVDHLVLAAPICGRLSLRSRVPTTLIANYFRSPDESHPSVSEANGRFCITYTGVFSIRRGLDHLLELGCAIREAEVNWVLRLVGICYLDRDRRWAEQHIRRESLEEIVRWEGRDRYVPWKRILAVHEQADVAVVLWKPHPAQCRNIPTKFYEYLHAGLPILCSDFPLWRQFVQANGCGAVVSPNDTDGLIQQLQAWSDDARRGRVAAAARAAAPRFDWTVMAQRLVGVYRQLT